jgi:hypothetical protein
MERKQMRHPMSTPQPEQLPWRNKRKEEPEQSSLRVACGPRETVEMTLGVRDGEWDDSQIVHRMATG